MPEYISTNCFLFSSYLDCYLYIGSGDLITRLYDKRDDFNFSIVNFPFLCSSIPSAPAYGVYVSQLIRYARAFKLSGLHGAWESSHYRVVEPGVSKHQIGSKKFYGRHHDLVNPYNVAVYRIVSDVLPVTLSRLPKSRTYASTYISFVQACGHGGRSLLTK